MIYLRPCTVVKNLLVIYPPPGYTVDTPDTLTV